MLAIQGDATIRQFCQFGLAVAALCFAGAYWIGGAPAAPATLGLLTAGLVLGLVAVLAPHRLRIPFVLLSAATAPIGWVVSHVILGLIYFAVITPTGILLRMLHRSPMDLEIDRQATSYWKRREAAPEPRDYLRQS